MKFIMNRMCIKINCKLKGIAGFFSLLILFTPVLQQPLSAQQTAFEEGTLLLDRGEYRAAIAVYDSIETTGYRSGALFLNKGVAYSGLNRLGIAKYYFLKAQAFPETEQLADASIQFLEERFTHRSAVLPELPWERFRSSMASVFGPNGLFWISILMLYLAAAGWSGAWFFQKKWMKYPAVISFTLFLLSVMIATSIHMHQQRYDLAVMIEEEAVVFARPATDSPEVSTAYEGYLMKIDWKKSDNPVLDPGERWMSIRLQNGQSGWIEAANLLWMDPLELR